MIIPMPDAVLQAQIDIVKQRFHLFINQPAAYRDLVGKGLAFQNSANVSEKLGVAQLGLISLELFQAAISGGGEYRMDGIQLMWDRLAAAGIVSKVFAFMPGAFADHVLDRFRLAKHLADDTFDNLFWPAASLLGRYASSVVAIDVDKEGDVFRGSGFILHLRQPLLVTCRHNVDPSEGIAVQNITTASSLPIAAPQFALHESFDLAIAYLDGAISGPLLRPGLPPSVFDATFTLGYPAVPHAKSGLVGHRGELNGTAELYQSRCPVLLISNLVSPGSSGCPVLSADGHCLGMTIQWLEGDYSQGAARFSAALPIDAIVAFANSYRP
jgi:S1-C subfamily serine protease